MNTGDIKITHSISDGRDSTTTFEAMANVYTKDSVDAATKAIKQAVNDLYETVPEGGKPYPDLVPNEPIAGVEIEVSTIGPLDTVKPQED